ncbi:MAG: outer membrane beta-barrel domain-containing protein [Gammaproteobacteria bacterium]|nr:outer membrane beta-barrel domain-containing protein [Gammaproteobacteria bacterium]
MANWFRSILLKSVVLAGLTWLPGYVLAAEDTETSGLLEENPVIEPRVARPEVDESKIDTENFELTAFTGFISVEDFGTSNVVGARLAFHVSELFYFEASAGQTTVGKTSYERLSGSVNLLTEDERDLSYYNVAIGFNVLPGEAFVTKNMAFNTAFYLIAGMGSTEFAGDERRTINYGFGYRLLATDWLAIHADMRDHVFDMELLGEKKSTHNIEMSVGISMFF